MRKFSILFISLLIVCMLPICGFASTDTFSVSIPDYYEKVSDTEWYTDHFMINDRATEVAIAVIFEESDLSYDDVFSEAFLASVEAEAVSASGFQEFVDEPTVKTTKTGYKNVFVSYVFDDSGTEYGVAFHSFYSGEQCCTFRFTASDPLYLISMSSETILDTVSFQQPFFMEEMPSEEGTVAPDESDALPGTGESNAQPAQKENADVDVVRVILFGVIIPVLFGLLAFWIGEAIYWCFDHGKWDKDAQPNPQAVVVGFTSKKKSLGRNNMKFITTVTFSDGYIFKTSKTKRTDRLLSYRISVDGELGNLIMQNAKKSHNKAIKKLK